MILPPVFTYTFWFQASPPPLLPIFDRLLLVLIAAFIITGVVAQVARLRKDFDKLTRRALAQAGDMFIITGIAALLLYVFAYERIVYLSMRVWLIVWLLWVVFWARQVIRYVTVQIPEIQKQREEQTRINKWMPKRK